VALIVLFLGMSAANLDEAGLLFSISDAQVRFEKIL
jgi:hypothetical protein